MHFWEEQYFRLCCVFPNTDTTVILSCQRGFFLLLFFFPLFRSHLASMLAYPSSSRGHLSLLILISMLKGADVIRRPWNVATLGCRCVFRLLIQLYLWCFGCAEGQQVGAQVKSQGEMCHSGSEMVWKAQQLVWGVYSKFPTSQSNEASVGCAEQTSLLHEGSTVQMTGLKGSAANIMVPDLTPGPTGVPDSGFGS